MIRHLASFALLALSLAPSALAQRDRTFKLDPVEAVAGREVPGEEGLTRVRGRYTYRFATEANRTAFDAEPERYEIQLGGACARMGPLSGEGSIGIHAVHAGKLYIFASTQCRKSFLDAPEALLDSDDLPPPPDAAADARGRELLALALKAIGGEGAIDAVTSWHARRDVKVESGGTTYAVRYESWLDFAGRRARRDECWDGACWGFTLTPGGAVALGSSGMESLVPDQRRALEKELGRELVAVLQGRASATISTAGARRIGEIDVEDVVLWRNGAATRLSIDPRDGRILASTWRDRGPRSSFGTYELRYTAWTKVGGLELPRAWEAFFEGKPWTERSGTWDVLELDATPDEKLFATK